jgi:putative transcriptional regulator
MVDQTDWAYVERMSPEEARQNALDDPDSQPLTPELRARLRRVPDPKAIRKRLGLSQEAFARQFEIALGTLRDWEQGIRIPDSTARAYLRVIERNPEAVASALVPTPVLSKSDTIQ